MANSDCICLLSNLLFVSRIFFSVLHPLAHEHCALLKYFLVNRLIFMVFKTIMVLCASMICIETTNFLMEKFPLLL